MRTKYLFTCFCICIFLLLTACSGSMTGTTSSSPTSTSKKDPSSIHVAFVAPNSVQNFAIEEANGARYAASQCNVNAQIVAPPTAGDNQAEVKLFQDVTSTATDGIAIFTLAPTLFVRLESNAIASGIPVVAVDVNGASGSGIKTFIGNDNVGAGKTFADEMISKLPANASGTVVIGVPNLSTPPLVLRAQGVTEELKAKLPNVTVLGPYATSNDPTSNYNAWNNLVKAHPGALAYIGTGNDDAVSLGKIKEANNGTYLTGGFDLDASSLAAVTSGVNFALLDPEHFLKGYIAMKLLIEHALNNKAIPEGWWNSGALVINQANVQKVIDRQKSLSARGAFFQPIADEEFANPSKYIQPLSSK
jgi:ribose transport system substrate-binding protein